MACRVLVVDDHPAFRAAAAALLAADGFDVVAEASTAAEAVHLARTLELDLVLLDVRLPDRDGIEVAAELAGLPHPPPVVLVSSRPARDLGQRLQRAPVLGFLAKAEPRRHGAAASARLPSGPGPAVATSGAPGSRGGAVTPLEHPLVQAADWLVAAVLLGGGVAAWRWSRTAAGLLVLAAVAWVLGGLLPAALFWHRVLLVHLLLALPGWRPPSRPGAVVVLLSYVVCVAVPSLVLVEAVNAGLAAATTAAAAWQAHGSRGPRRYPRVLALAGAGVLLVAVLLGALLRGTTTGPGPAAASLLGYEAAVVLVVVLVVRGLRPPSARALTDLVVDLADGRTTTPAQALARTLRDPELRLGVWDGAAGSYLDEHGRPVTADPVPDRSPVLVDRDGEPVALLLLDSRLAADRTVRAAVATAARLVAVHARREAALTDDLAALRASRRRLLDVADAEGRRLAAELSAGVGGDLDRLALQVRDVVAAGGASAHLARALEHLEQTRLDLDDVAAGLRPRDLALGLSAALQRLAARGPTVVSLHDDDPARTSTLAPAVELAAWFVCAEGVTNAVRHAPGAAVALRLAHRADRLVVTVTDDGPGGARARAGGGLTGLRDRVEACGGRLDVRSTEGGTTLAAELPVAPG